MDAWNEVAALLLRLGLRMHPLKGVRDGPTTIQLLGHVIDTEAGLFRLPAACIDKTVGLAKSLESHATAHHRWVH